MVTALISKCAKHVHHSEARALVCDESLVQLANEATKGKEPSFLRICISGS